MSYQIWKAPICKAQLVLKVRDIRICILPSEVWEEINALIIRRGGKHGFVFFNSRGARCYLKMPPLLLVWKLGPLVRDKSGNKLKTSFIPRYPQLTSFIPRYPQFT